MKSSLQTYRKATILRLNLRDDEKMIVIHDLHFSHQSEAVRDYCAANNIILVYIPAGCTDLLQMCDLVLNKPYKSALSAAFVKYVAGKFADHTASAATAPFALSMAISVMKPLLPDFVNAGLSALSTPEMRQTIGTCFLTEGLVQQAKLPESLAAAKALLLVDDGSLMEGDEPQQDLGPVDDNGTGDEEYIIEVQEDSVGPDPSAAPAPVPAPAPVLPSQSA